MRKRFAGIALTALLTHAAYAHAGEPRWTGFYGGFNGGYAWQDGRDRLVLTGIDNANQAAPIPLTRALDIGRDGSFGGGQIGYNYQWGRFVLGVETDIQRGFHNNGSLTFVNDGTFSASATSDLDWFGTVRGRVGYTFDRALFYATAGFAYGSVNNSLTVHSEHLSAPNTTTVNDSSTATGTVWGGGVEISVNPALSLKAEYQRIDLGDTKLAATALADSGEDKGVGSLSASHTYDTVRFGVNFHLN